MCVSPQTASSRAFMTEVPLCVDSLFSKISLLKNHSIKKQLLGVDTEMIQRLRALTALLNELSSIPSSDMQFAIFCNSSSRSVKALLWPP